MPTEIHRSNPVFGGRCHRTKMRLGMTVEQTPSAGNAGKRDPNQCPFPGMDPFLEQSSVWHDFHESFIYECRRLLVPQISPAYVAKLDEHIYIHELAADERRLIGRRNIAVAEQPAVDLERENRIEIRDRESGRIISVIELLSPSNKQPGQDRRQFLGKRDELLASEINYIEIDLLRGGPRMPLENMPACDYCVLVSRREERPRVGIWPIHLRDGLPEIPIPLRAGDRDAKLNLQAALHDVYDRAAYGAYIYEDTPQPPLSEKDAAWAEATLQNR